MLNFIAVDLETTGLDPASCDVIEIGWQVVRDGTLLGDAGDARFVCDPHQSCSYEGNPATDDAWNRRGTYLLGQRSHPYTLNEIFGLLIDAADLCNGRPSLCFHNAPFDVSFLSTAAVRRGLSVDWLFQESKGPFSRRCIDTQALGMARRLPKLALGSMCEQFGVVNVAPHTAAGDARATAELALKLLSSTGEERLRLDIEIEVRRNFVNASAGQGERGRRMHDFRRWLSGIEFATGLEFDHSFDSAWQPTPA